MASMERIAIISSLSAAIAASLQLAPTLASAGTSEATIETANELAAMRSIAIAKWRREHPNPPPRHPATTVPVTTCADDGSAGTLRSVLATVSTGDVVDLTGLSCDTITLNPALGYLMPNLAAGEFSIQGPGMQSLTISGGHEIQVLGNLEDIVINISDLSIADGYADDSWGGCLLAFAPYGGFRLTRVTVSGCEAHQVDLLHGSAVHGGAIMTGGTLELTDSIVTGNTVSSELPDAFPYQNGMYGGGISVFSGPVTITHSSITSNTIVSSVVTSGFMGGGGLSVQSAIYDVTITDSVISGNTLDSTFVDDSGRVSRLSGAGLRAYQANTGLGNLVVSKSTFDSNTITSAANLLRIYGAGIAEAMNMTLSYSTLSANDSAGYAGALMARGFFPCAISNSTFSGNHASGKGGAIFGAGPISLDSSTVAFNSSDSDAGGVYFNDNALFSSSIVARNNGAPHPDFMVSSTAIVTGNNDFIGDPAGLVIAPGTLTGDPMLAPLADNGGPTKTHALLSNSTAIDAGANGFALQYDQRGPGFPRVNGPNPDIGAFETGTLATDEIFANGFDP